MSTTQISKKRLNNSTTTHKDKQQQSSLSQIDQYSLQVKSCTIPLSEDEYKVVWDVLIALRQGKLIKFVDDDTYITTQEAAEILNISRPYFVKLLENGEIPFIKVGNRRRILAKNVFLYKTKRNTERRQALQEFSQGIYEDGLYDLDYESVQEILNND